MIGPMGMLLAGMAIAEGGRGVLIQAGEEAGALAADFNGGAGFRGQQPDAEVDGWDLPQHGQGIAPLFQPVARGFSDVD